MHPCRKCENHREFHIKISDSGEYLIRCSRCGESTGWWSTLDKALAFWGTTVTDHIRDLEREIDKYKPHSQIMSSLPSCMDCLIQGRCGIAPKLGTTVRINCPLHIKRKGD